MPDVKYYTDEHVAKAIVRGLRQRGIDVLTTPDAGLLSASDQEHFDYALTRGRVIFTQDDDFLRLAARNSKHAGIVYAHQHTPVGDIVRGLVLIFQVLTADEMNGNIEFL